MAYDVYPAALTNPLNLAAAATSAESFTERLDAGGGINNGGVMYLRFAMSNPASSCAPPGADLPGIFLSANGGTAIEVTQTTEYPTVHPIFDSLAVYVAGAGYTIEPNGVYMVEVHFYMGHTGSSWEVQIQNNAASTREFTWVVADTLVDNPLDRQGASQPWMELAQGLNVDSVLGGDILLTGQAAQITLSVTNKGTGILNINDVAGSLGGSDFEILSVPMGPIASNACDDIMLQFNAPASSGESTFDYNVSSDDTKATVAIPAATHNERVSLSGTAGKLEVIMVLDASGSMAFLPDGSASGVSVSDMRWGHMRSAAEGFLDLLTHFAPNLGRVGVVLFPDIVSGVPDPDIADAIVLQPAIDIPADASAIKTLLTTNTPTAGEGNTPLGFGIGTAMGTAVGSFGEFLGSQDDVDFNPRWMVVMSDGFHNLGPPPPTNFYGPIGDQSSFRGKNVKVIAVSYGDPGAVKWPPDQAQMEALRTESDGLFLDAGPNDTGLDLLGDLGLNVAKSFRAAITAGLFLDPTIDPGVTLTASNSEVRRDVSVLPYDTKVCFAVNWVTENQERVDVQILTPDCQLITASVAQADPDIKYSSGARYQMFTFDNEFLRNTEGEPRDGTWKLVASADALKGGDTEPVEYEIITKSRLRMRLNPCKQKYYAGDSIEVSAKLTLDGKPIRNASVTMRAETPGNFFNNWFSQRKITQQEYDVSKAELGNVELTSIAIKSHALAQKGIVFQGFNNSNTSTMNDPEDEGLYSASVSSSTVPGTYTFYVIAMGETEDGVTFRREQRLQIYLDVRPLPEFTLVDIVYTLLDDDRLRRLAEITVWPRDRFGNVLLVDPEINPSVILTAQGGELSGPLLGNLDGSYTQKLHYAEDARPVFNLEVNGAEVIQRFETAPLNDVRYADKLINYTLGNEVEKGANLHSDPRAALGDVIGTDSFVSLGAHGSITLGVIGESFMAQGDDDITVFIHSDPDSATQLRSYEVQAQAPSGGGNWVSLGQSKGTTQSFSLRAGGLDMANAIRIIDKSGVVLDNLEVSNAPGVSIKGVGFKKSGLKPGGADGCLFAILGIFKLLFARHK